MNAVVNDRAVSQLPLNSRDTYQLLQLQPGVMSTVGSSNLDPLSLSLNLEANVVIRDRDFNAKLAERLESLMRRPAQRQRQLAAHPSPAAGVDAAATDGVASLPGTTMTGAWPAW